MILKYDEESNVQKLSQAHPRARTVFALLCAVRLFPAYRRFHASTGQGEPTFLEALLDRLWKDAAEPELGRKELEDAIERCLHLVPDEDGNGNENACRYDAADAVSALVYALQVRLSGDAQEAAWAGQCAIEAVDRFVNLDKQSFDSEDVVYKHPLIQAELCRQKRDLEDIAELEHEAFNRSRLQELRRRSEREANTMLT